MTPVPTPVHKLVLLLINGAWHWFIGGVGGLEVSWCWRWGCLDGSKTSHWC